MPLPPDRALQLVQRSAAAARLAHAYIISGPPGSGKDLLARTLSAQLLEAPPDAPWPALERRGLSIVRPESKSRRIVIEQMRALERTLHLSGGAHRIGVIVDADRMMPQAANAFLKTLEEPPPGTLLLLLTPQPQAMLATILSRCLKLELKPPTSPSRTPTEQALLTLLSSHAANPSAGLTAAMGLMRQVVALLQGRKDSIAVEHAQTLKDEKDLYAKTSEGDYLKRREKALEALGEAHYQAERDQLLSLLLSWWGDALRQYHQIPHLDLPDHADATRTLAQRLPEEELHARFQAALEIIDALKTNAQESLVLECGFLAAFS
jgi:DNA polymerase III subunit delta'